jgi:hypothetical protein
MEQVKRPDAEFKGGLDSGTVFSTEELSTFSALESPNFHEWL